MLRIDQMFNGATRIRASGAVAALIAGCLFGTSASAEAPAPPAPSVHAHSVAADPASPATKNVKPGKKPVVSPYARAAAQRERAGQPPAGHAPTMVQAMGKPHKPHPAAPHK